MLKNLRIKFLKTKRNYIQGKILLQKAELLINKSKKLQIAGLVLVLCLSIGGMFYGKTDAIGIKKSANSEYTGESMGKNVPFMVIIKNIIGTVPYEDETSEENENGEKTGYYYEGDVSDGALAKLSATTGSMYINGPVGTQQYLAYLGQKADIGPSALYAADSIQGFDILQPIIVLWEWARNIVYVFYVIVFIIIGIMIIMRHRLGGQVPITVINSIPNILLSLVLVTFSYAISGLIIDAMHLATGVIYTGFFGASSDLGVTEPYDGAYSFQSPEMSVFKVFGTAQISDFSASFNISDIEGLEGAWILNNVIGVLEDVVEWNTLISVVLSIAAVSAMFKIFFTLLTKYLGFMFSPVIAPFQFFIGSFPGKANLIWEWFKGMFSSVGAFVGIYVVFCLMIVITDDSVVTGWNWFPPLTGFSSTTDTVAHLLGYALFIAAPNVPPIIEKALQTQPTGLMGNVGAETQKAASKVPIIGGFFG